MNKREQGSLTVFYAAVFSAAIGLMLALLSLGRARIMETQVRKDLDLAAFGVRAEYQKEWAREYGLYMIPESRLTGGFEFYLKETGIHPSGDYTYSDIFVVGEETLGDPNQLEKQITGLMEERGWLSLMEEVTELLKEAVEGAEATAEVSEATGGVAGSAALVDIQTVYASLVTDMEGLRNDGTREFYFVNGLLEEDPSYDDILLILQSMKTEAAAHETAVGEGEEPHKAFGSVSSHQLGELERTSQWMEEAQRLCLSAEGKMDALAEMVREIEEDSAKTQLLELLPFDGEDMEEYSRIMAENLEALGEASEGLEKLIHMLDMTPPSPAEVEEAIMSFRALEDYDRSIHLPYEYREASGHLDLAELLRRAQGFPAGIGELAPDVDKDLTWMYAGPESTREYTLEDLSLGEGFQAAYLRAEYATGFFRNFRETVAESNGEVPRNLRGDKKKKGTFDNQVEYLIVGSCNEFQNVNGTRQRLLGVRTLMNAAYLLSDPVKRQEIESLAAATGGILLPGVGDIIAFAAILSGWSLAESAEDYRILTEGGKIPLWKTDDTWQTDLESLLEDGSQGAGETSAEGLDYEAYLRILLYMTPRETTLCRIQEMLYLDHDEFPLEEAVTGFRVYGSASGISTLTFEGSYRFYEDRSPGEEHE